MAIGGPNASDRLLGLLKQQRKAIRIAGDGAAPHFVAQLVVESIVQGRIIDEFESGRLDFFDGQHRVHTPPVLFVFCLHMAAGVIDGTVVAARFKRSEGRGVDRCATSGRKIVQVAESENEVHSFRFA